MAEFNINVQIIKRTDRKFFTMRYRDPIRGDWVARSTKTNKRRDAERAAAKWEKELREGKYHEPNNISWDEFRERYESEKLSSLSENMFETTSTVFNHVETIINPQKLMALTPTVLSRFQAELRKQKLKETSIATHLRHLRAALNWAVAMGLLPKAPDVSMPKRASGRKLMRGRPLSAVEFQRMTTAVPKIRPQDARVWQHYLEGLWLSGLRLEESTIFSWEIDSPICADLTGRHPRLRIYAEAEKGHEDRLLPMTPDFAEFLMATPEENRTGRIFKVNALTTGKPMSLKRVSRVVSSIGKKANIVVNKADGKFASAHDLRRSYGTRWASRVKPATLQLLMRHKSIETTLKYYVEQDSDEIAEELWNEHQSRNDRGSNSSDQADA